MRKVGLIFAIAFIVLSLGVVLCAQSLTVSPKQTGHWTVTKNMLQARTGAAAVAMSDGSMLITGGVDEGGAILASAEVFAADGSFKAAAPMNVPRTGHTATWLKDASGAGGCVLVTGGTSSGGVVLATAELFDPAANTWTYLAPMSEARSGHPAAALADGSVLAAGGSNMYGVLSSAELFSLSSQQFMFGGALQPARKDHAAAALKDNRVLLVGGTDVNGATLASVAIYDPTIGAIYSGPNLSTPRANATATTLLDGTVLIAGGSYAEGAVSNGGVAELQSAEIFDPVAGTMTPVATMMVTARARHQAFLLPNSNNVLLVGGSYNGTDLASAELYIPWMGKFKATGAMSIARSNSAGAALFPMVDGQLLLAGGSNQKSGELYGFATVRTDRSDYAPGTPVLISGAGWKPLETVSLYMKALPETASVAPVMTTTADVDGKIFDGTWAPDATDLGALFYLTAVGGTSGAKAQNTFTDGSVTVTVTGVGTVAGNPALSPASCTSSQTTGCTVNLGNGASIVLTASGGSVISWTLSSKMTGTAGCGAGANNCTAQASSGSGGTVTVLFKSNPTISWSAAPPASAAYNSQFTVVATSNSTGAIAYSTTGGCSNNGGTVTMTSGTTACEVTASVAADSNYNAGTVGPTSVTASKASPTIAWSTAPPTSAAYNSAFTVVATSNSTGTISYSTSGGCSNVGGKVTMTSGNTACAVTAYVASDANYGAGTVGPTSVTASKTTATPTLTSSVNPSAYGQSTTFTATLPAGTTGSVTFKDGGTTLGTGTLSGGTATTSASALAVGSGHSITAVYGGDGNYNTATSAALTQTVNQASTSTSVTSSGNPSIYDQAVTFTATVSAVAPGSGTPSGTVTFKDGATTLGTGTLSSGLASYLAAARSLAAGSHSITAVYGADTNFAASTSTVLTQTSNKATPTITTAPTASGITYGQTLSSSTLSGGVGSVAGSFAFTTPATSPVVGTASQDVTFTPTDTTNYNTVSLQVSVTVSKATPTITTLPTASGITYGSALSASTLSGGAGSVGGSFAFATPATVPNAGNYSASITFTPTDGANYNTVSGVVNVAVGKATVTVTLGGLNQTFDGTGKVATASTTPDNLAVTLTYNGLAAAPTAAGNYAVLATVVDANYQGSASGTLTIAQATAVVTLSNLSHAYNGTPQVVTITTTPSPLGIVFSYSGIDPTSYATTDVAPTEPGSYAVVATVFDPNYIGQATGTLTITKLDPALQFALRTGMPEQTPYGAWVYFDLGMAKTPCPTGTAQLYVDGQASGAAVVLNGSDCSQAVEFKIATLLSGTHDVNAIYSGDGHYAGNTSGTVAHNVVANSTTVAVSASGQIVNVGQAVTFTATVTPTAQDGNTQAPTGAVQFFDGAQPIGGVNSLTTVSPYTATLTISSLAAGPHSITAQYTSADGLYAGSSSAVTLDETVNTITPTIAWANPADIVYGTKLGADQLNATATYDGATVDGTFAYNPPKDTVLPVGQLNLQVTFTPTDTATYGVQTATATINVTEATLTVKADDASRVYGTGNPTLTYQVSGFVNNDSTALVGGSASCSTLADAASLVAGSPYAITCKQDTLTAANYRFNFVDGSLTVSKAPLTVNANHASKTYGSINPALSGLLIGALDGDNITASYDTTTGTYSAVGDYAITATLIDPNHKLDNYTVTNTPGTLTITPASQTITVTKHALTSAAYNSQFTVAATSSSALPVSISATGVCSINGSTVTMTSGSATCVIKYDQAGDANYSAAPEVVESVGTLLPNPTPTFSPSYGTFTTPQLVTVTGATGVPIYYTTDGSTPTTASRLYTGPITVSSTTTIKAIAAGNGSGNSAIGSLFLAIVAPTPTFSPSYGTYTTPQSVTMTGATGVPIYYTTDGSTPTTASSLYTGPITVSRTTTIKAIAIGNGYGSSAIGSASITIAAAKPTFSPSYGTFTTPQSVTVTGTAGAPIYYTTDGSNPTTASSLYTGPITVSSTTTIKAIAIGNGYGSSAIGSASITIVAPTPTFSPSYGTYTKPLSVMVTSAAGAPIYYTTDGSTPTTASRLYTGPITVSSTTTIKAIAIGNGYGSSAIGSASITVR